MRILIFLLMLPLAAFAQPDIEQIRNDSDVVNFIRELGHEYFPFAQGRPLHDISFAITGRRFIYTEKQQEADARFTDSVLAKRWVLDDYDGDRKKDMVYYGRIGNEAGIFVFFGGSSRKMIRLTDGFANWYPHSIESYKIGNVSSIIVGTLQQSEWRASQQKPFSERFFHDTLVYKFDGFTEYNSKAASGPAFDSIEFRPLSNWVSGNNWYLRIHKNGQVTYVRCRNSSTKDGFEFITEKMVADIEPGDWQNLLDYINFAQLKDSFELKNVSDQTVANTTVYFADGTKKNVWDYGMTGTYGLETLYRKMYSLTGRRDWQVIARRKGYLGYRGEF